MASSESVSPALIVVMGVSGCGKSTLGQNLSKALDFPFYDGDSLHPQPNIDKMSKGIPLTDNDREPWLALIRSTADQICRRSDSAGPRGLVMACSALKRTYRDILRGVHPKAHEPPPPEEIPEHPITEHVHDKEALAEPPAQNLRTFFVFIKGGREVLEERMRARKDHFMKVDMLRSQLETLQDPTGEEGVVVIRLEDGMDEQVQEAVKGLAEAGL